MTECLSLNLKNRNDFSRSEKCLRRSTGCRSSSPTCRCWMSTRASSPLSFLFTDKSSTPSSKTRPSMTSSTFSERLFVWATYLGTFTWRKFGICRENSFSWEPWWSSVGNERVSSIRPKEEKVTGNFLKINSNNNFVKYRSCQVSSEWCQERKKKAFLFRLLQRRSLESTEWWKRKINKIIFFLLVENTETSHCRL